MIATPLREMLINGEVETVDQIRLVRAFGDLIHHLRVDDLIRFLDTSGNESRSAFAEFNDGMRSAGGKAISSAYLQLVINSAANRNSADFLRIAQPFLRDVFGLMVAEGAWLDSEEVVAKCSIIWSLVRSRCALTGASLESFRDMALPLLGEESRELGCSDRTAKGLRAYGILLQAMDLVGNEDFCNESFDAWSTEELDERDEQGEHVHYDAFDAFLSPFDEFDGVAPLCGVIERRNASRFRAV